MRVIPLGFYRLVKRRPVSGSVVRENAVTTIDFPNQLQQQERRLQVLAAHRRHRFPARLLDWSRRRHRHRGPRLAGGPCGDLRHVNASGVCGASRGFVPAPDWSAREGAWVPSPGCRCVSAAASCARRLIGSPSWLRAGQNFAFAFLGTAQMKLVRPRPALQFRGGPGVPA